MPVLRIYPIGAGFYGENIPFPGGSNHWADVDDDPNDGNTSYIYGSSLVAFRRDTFTHPASGLAGTIDKIRVTSWTRRTLDVDDGGALRCAGKHLLRTATPTDIASAEFPGLAFNYFENYAEWTTNPDTGLPWTIGQVDSLEFGCSSKEGYVAASSTPVYLRFSAVYLDIYYTSGAAPPAGMHAHGNQVLNFGVAAAIREFLARRRRIYIAITK